MRDEDFVRYVRARAVQFSARRVTMCAVTFGRIRRAGRTCFTPYTDRERLLTNRMGDLALDDGTTVELRVSRNIPEGVVRFGLFEGDVRGIEELIDRAEPERCYRCTACSSLWKENTDGSWSLLGAAGVKCCDNTADFLQRIPPSNRATRFDRDDVV